MNDFKPIFYVCKCCKKQHKLSKHPNSVCLDEMVKFSYKGEEQTVIIKEESNGDYFAGICQEDNKYKEYLIKYIEKVFPRIEPLNEEDDDETVELPITHFI